MSGLPSLNDRTHYERGLDASTWTMDFIIGAESHREPETLHHTTANTSGANESVTFDEERDSSVTSTDNWNQRRRISDASFSTRFSEGAEERHDESEMPRRSAANTAENKSIFTTEPALARNLSLSGTTIYPYFIFLIQKLTLDSCRQI